MIKNNAAVEFINDEISHLPDTGVYFDEQEEPDVFQRIRAFCDTSNASDTLALYRAVPNSKKEDFIVDIDTIDFSPGFIKERFGGGSYIIKAYDDKSKMRLKQHLSIEGRPIIGSGGALTVQPVAQQIDIQAIMHAMQESNRQLLTGLVQALAPQPSTSRADMLAEMATMREIFGSPQQNTVDPMSMLIKGIELAGSMTPKAGGETSGMDVLLESIKSFAPAIGAVVAQSAAKTSQQSRAPAPQAQRQIGVSTATATHTPPEISTETETESENDMLIKMYLAQLVSYAKANKDPSLYADLIADNLSDEQIMSMLSRPNVVEYLAGINPEVNDVSLWFESLILELKIIMGLTEPVSSNTVIAPIVDLTSKNAQGND